MQMLDNLHISKYLFKFILIFISIANITIIIIISASHWVNVHRAPGWVSSLPVAVLLGDCDDDDGGDDDDEL